ncbi:HEPN domain-containing protein [Candidatus Parcubacteria bacterium]|nr:HEPN domain-containing protein [Patescibacteria group bacterium]MBU4482395.1 HEPN domain-containing protein [Patescibacteria group bacterium]MCG2687004.1 HEPN domain-containing protein [Candidatus Parcubacteria bacterium]
MRKYKISEQEINIILQEVDKRIKSAEHSISGGFYRDSISRSYYAILDISRALLLKNNLVAKTHAGTITLFGLHFVKNNLIAAKYGRIFNKVAQARIEADYELLKKFDKQDAKQILLEAKDFIKEVKKLINNN